jgi:CRISPR-associated endonuclease/helicase Cas3
LKAPDVADEKVPRFRRLRVSTGDVVEVRAVVGDLGDVIGLACFTLDLPCEGDARAQLVSFVPRRERAEFGARRRRLWRHVGQVRRQARILAERLPLQGEVRAALELAAAWHDHGKNRQLWQFAVGWRQGERPLAKSDGPMRRVPGGYRHEFGSLREFAESQEGAVAWDVFDLAMHMIATHHGRGRPHFPKGGFDPDARAKSAEIGAGVIRRFARLQRKYGYWQLAWLESLLRCADAMASAEGK